MTGPDPSQIPPQSPTRCSPHTPYGQPGAAAGQSQSPYGQQPYRGGGRIQPASSRTGAGRSSPRPSFSRPRVACLTGRGWARNRTAEAATPWDHRARGGGVGTIQPASGIMFAGSCCPSAPSSGWSPCSRQWWQGHGDRRRRVAPTIVGSHVLLRDRRRAGDRLGHCRAECARGPVGLVDPYQPGREQAQAQGRGRA